MKEEANALAMRQRFNERAVKFMDSKQRTIGIDKQCLDEQLEERKRQIELDKQQDLKEGKHLFLLLVNYWNPIVYPPGGREQ